MDHVLLLSFLLCVTPFVHAAPLLKSVVTGEPQYPGYRAILMNSAGRYDRRNTRSIANQIPAK